MRKELLGVNDDGSPRYSYTAEGDETLVITGKIVASLTMDDGTVYDVTDPVVAVADEHVGELHHAIGDYYEANGHPDVPDFVHDREATQQMLDSLRAAGASTATPAVEPTTSQEG